jgi:N-methylhydantoinase A/oxoprolinase/acetone carboxylase beta subunit
MIIGLDVGGTHADVVLMGEEGLINEKKVPTNPKNLFETVLSSLEEITEGIDPARIRRVVLSTTLTTNAIVQNQLPPVGVVVSCGPGIDPEVYRTNEHYFKVSGAVDHRGRENCPIHPEEIKSIGRRLQSEGIRLAAIVGKFSVRNPAHEIGIGEILKPYVEKVFLGHRISGGLNFPRRIATAYLNAAVYPLHKSFYSAVESSLEAKGLSLPIRILKADGGNMKFQSSIEYPGQTILSGPAASVMGSLAFAGKGIDSMVMDIGGTTTDMAILVDQDPLLDPLGIELGGYKTLIRSLDTVSIGIGGDSRIRYSNGRLSIGPDRLGPAMAYGGPTPTPTDAICVLECVEGTDKERSVRGLESISAAMGLPVEAAALKIFDHTCRLILDSAERMIQRANSKPVYTVHELRDGYSVKPSELLVMGGPAPYFARHLEKISKYKVRVIPHWELANAIGAALARTTCEVTFFADTEQNISTAPEENYTERIGKDFTSRDAVKKALKLLEKKAIQRGANPDHLEMEVLEEMQFNMVRGFYTTGKNIRVRVQVRPGLIHGYDKLIQSISDSAPPGVFHDPGQV